jgi:hypothetical protein
VLVVCVQINESSNTQQFVAGVIEVGMSDGSAITGAFASAAVADTGLAPILGNYFYIGSVMFIVPPNGVYMANFVELITPAAINFTWFEY